MPLGVADHVWTIGELLDGTGDAATSAFGPSRRFQWLTVSVAIGAERTSLDLQPFPAGRE
jgi:hypothetical protein